MLDFKIRVVDVKDTLRLHVYIIVYIIIYFTAIESIVHSYFEFVIL